MESEQGHHILQEGNKRGESEDEAIRDDNKETDIGEATHAKTCAPIFDQTNLYAPTGQT
jgi:hypothetical protein